MKTKKTIFDAWNGYHSVPLHEDDRYFTSFITPWGRYRYCTSPQGYIASGDGYTSRYDGIVSHINKKTKCIDDTLLWSDSISDAYSQAVEWLHICATNGVTLNPEKFHFAEDSVEFAGFEITPTTVKPCRKYIRAITDFPTPKNLTDVSLLHIQHDIGHGTIQGPTETLGEVRLDRISPISIQQLQVSHRQGNPRRGEDLRQNQTNLSSNRLVKERDRVLAIPEALPVPIQRRLLLPNWMEGHPSRITIHPRCGISLCSN